MTFWRTVTWAAVLAFWPAVASAGLVVSASIPTSYGWTFGHFSATGQYLGARGPVDEELNSLTRGPDGYIYVLANTLGQGRVLRVPPTFTGVIESLNTFTWGGEFTVPLGLAFDPAGRVYAGSNAFRPNGGGFVDQGIYRFNRPGMTRMFDLPPTTGLLRDIEIDAAGNLFVAVDGEGVHRFAGMGQRTFTIALSTRDFDLGLDGKLYVATPSSGILKFDATSGAALGTFIAAGSQGLADAHDMVFGDDGVLYVNSRGIKTIFKFDATTGSPMGVFATYGQATGVTDINSMVYLATVVPEPGTCSALMTGAVWLMGRRARRTGHY